MNIRKNVLCALAAAVWTTADAQMNMRQLSVNEGLSQYCVSDIEQDKYGFIWLATFDGLNRYDGAGINIYKENPDKPGSLSSSRIKSLYFDYGSDRLFVGTDGGGLNVYDYVTDTFKCYHIRHGSNKWFPENDIIDICPEKEGRIWVATRRHIFLVDVVNEDITVAQTISYPTNRVINSLVSIDGALITVARHRAVKYVLSGGKYILDSDIPLPENASVNSAFTWKDCLYFATTDGIYRLYDMYSGNRLEKISISSTGMLSDNENVSAIRKKDDEYIFTVEGKGLYGMGEKDGRVRHIATGNDSFWKDNTVRNAIIDNSGIMWIASQNKGAGFIDLGQVVYRKIDLYGGEQPCITSLMLTPDNSLWIGTETKGLFVRDSTGNIRNMLHGRSPVSDIKYFRDGSVKTVYDDKVYSIENGRAREIFPLHYDWAETMGSVFNVCEDRYGTLWLGCRKGVAGILPDGSHVISRLETSFFINVIPTADGEGLWVCSGRSGLIRYSINNGKSLSIVKHYTNSAADTSSISSNTVWTVCETSSGDIYAGTEMGLDIIDSGTLALKRKGGGILSESNIFAIREDSAGILWINTSRGIVRYDPADGSEKICNSSDGLVSSYMTPAAAISGKDTLYVGTNEGINCFHTADFPQKDNTPPQIAVSGIMAFDKPMTFDKPVMDLTEIVLPHYCSSITFRLSIMSYANPEKNRYAYRLLGYDDRWTLTGAASPFAAFNKLKKGRYVFEFKGWDNDNPLSASTVSIGIVIRPAWWNTAAAYCLYALIFAGLAYLTIMYFKYRIRQKSEAEANEAKIRFYDNLTHEFRTPLTLVAAPLSELAEDKDLPAKATEKISIIRRNVDRLLDLANHFLDLRKIDSNKMPLTVRYSDIGLIVRNIVYRFEPMAEHTRIDLSCSIQEENMSGWADENKITTIVTNLLSNALKFTPRDGHVSVTLTRSGNEYVIAVADDGCGISGKDMDNIFERFYQVEKRPVSGTGIGLDLSMSLAKLHKGWLKGESKLGEGATFTFGFPYTAESYSSNEMEDNTDAVSGGETHNEIKPQTGSRRMCILIVEDDAEMRTYIESILSSKYDTVHADNGKKGIETALEAMPDLIISDVMMPVMDGIAMCRMITEDFRTSHIPVILLTAKNSELAGLQAGAVDYIMKPFEPQSLLLKTDNLLKYKASLKLSGNSGESILQKIRDFSEQKEKDFLEKTYGIVEKNMANGDFKVEDLMKELGVSKSQLHKKITALTGQSASAFIRNIRLDKAREMLSTGKYSITEVLYSVGFNSPSYFSKMFRERFGILPSELLQGE